MPRQSQFTTAAGATIELRGLSPWMLDAIAPSLEQDWQDLGREKPSPPTYVVTTVGGSEQVHPHDETTLESDEDRAEWAAYQRARAEWEKELRERMTRVVLAEGVLAGPADDDWIANQKFLGLRVPDDPRARRLHWIRTQLIQGPEDAQGIVAAVLALSGLSEEKLRAAERSFRDPVAEPGRPGAEPAAPAEG